MSANRLIDRIVLDFLRVAIKRPVGYSARATQGSIFADELDQDRAILSFLASDENEIKSSLDCPTIGCAKSILVGEAAEPGVHAGSTAPLVDKGEKVGVALRTRDQVRPIYVTVGHRVSLESAVRIVTQCTDGLRIPKPTREADHWVGELRRAYQKGISHSFDLF